MIFVISMFQSDPSGWYDDHFIIDNHFYDVNKIVDSRFAMTDELIKDVLEYRFVEIDGTYDVIFIFNDEIGKYNPSSENEVKVNKEVLEYKMNMRDDNIDKILKDK